jgi:hypothetical protein
MRAIGKQLLARALVDWPIPDAHALCCRDMAAACDRHIVRAWVKRPIIKLCMANAFCSG